MERKNKNKLGTKFVYSTIKDLRYRIYFEEGQAEAGLCKKYHRE